MKQGARTDLSPIGEMSQAKAAELLNVGKRSVERAADVRESGAPELVRAVERGEVSVTAAADVATMPLEAQRELLARCDKRELVRGCIERHVDWRQLEILNVAEASEREFLRMVAGTYGGSDHDPTRPTQANCSAR